MPTSTKWRKPWSGLPTRASSPVRPSIDSIERLTPEPLDPPLPAVTTSHKLQHPPDDFLLHGLGLTNTDFPERSNRTVQPDHLYFDQNGGAYVGTKVVPTTESKVSRTSQVLQRIQGRKPLQQGRQTATRSHARSGSTIDDLATVAIATSPNFANQSPQTYTFDGSPRTYNRTRPSTSHIDRYEFNGIDTYGPPPKRVKSEKLPNTEWSIGGELHEFNHQQSSERISEDVELLLGLRNAVNFKTQLSPAPQLAYLAQSLSDVPSNNPVRSPHIAQPEDLRLTNLPVIHQPLIPDDQIAQNQEDKQIEDRSIDGQIDHQEKSLAEITDVLRKPSEAKVNALTALKASTEDETDVSTTSEVQRNQEDKNNNEVPELQRKRPRRIKPEVQAEVCARCLRLQWDPNDEDTGVLWISCNGCNKWFHSFCVGLKSKSEARSVDKFVCKDCEPQHGPTTFVRKSTRARTDIDYAGLNEGVVQSSVDTSMHHYVQPIKDGTIKFLPDDFARIRPEVLAVDLLEGFDGMKRPFVVPACWNPRFGAPRGPDITPIVDPTYTEIRYDSSGHVLGPDPEDMEDPPFEEVIDCDQDLLDMIMPRDLTVRKVAELYGPDEPVPVIDVKSQETKGVFTLSQWADYYELPGEKPIRNVISLEVSESRLGRLIRRPKVVRDLDLEDHVWDADSKTAAKKRPVQFYCLMSVADSYTDFHIDFGGSSVYYHILKGTKTFFFIPPEDRYLKKYEDWCNSDTQNITFLGDLCGGNCTRVDLHEGDTAFIPAGWIHAVWTPEDSLVIGGNFLTRLDYEMQLKVVHIEKVTKVSPKFRYPFFQKVMWYALIKYLDQDPLPEEVLQDFLDDPNYTFLRANPVWYEIGELAISAPPEDPGHNARYYPKAEIRGLPALRDYLYRTARIHADLPVPDINKKGIEAVKASIPKGHGDPLILIKQFAIWCAWKTGEITAPEWVHSDTGTLSDFEKKEKTKKPEVFRVPGERSSMRKASQPQSRESPDVTSTTPVKQLSVAPEYDSDSKKSKSSTKAPNSLLACDSCRKRRIRCRHKLDDDQTSSLISDESRDDPDHADETQPLVSLPLLSDFVDLPPAEPFMVEPNLTLDIAQAALATLDSNVIDLGPGFSNSTAANPGKKSRSKACEECRKSKRRCVHDEHGRVDPAKAAEPSKPRGSSNAKRPARVSDELAQLKRVKMNHGTNDSSSPTIGRYENIEAMIDPALVNGDYDLPPFVNQYPEVPNSSAYAIQESLSMLDRAPQSMAVSLDFPIDPALQGSMIAENDTAHIKSEIESHVHTQEAFQLGQQADEPRFIDPAISETPHKNNRITDGSGVDLESMTEDVSPKNISAQTGNEVQGLPKTGDKVHSTNKWRDSSATSAHSSAISVKSRRSSSNTSGTTHQIVAMMNKSARSRDDSVRPVSHGSLGGESELDADEKFARELQAAENGLRRRASVRA